MVIVYFRTGRKSIKGGTYYSTIMLQGIIIGIIALAALKGRKQKGVGSIETKRTIYFIKAVDRYGNTEYQIYDKLLDTMHSGMLYDLRVYATEKSAQKALQELNASYGFMNGEAYIVEKELPDGFMYKNNRLKRVW